MPRASQDYNLYLLKPSLIMEWHPTKNIHLRPRDVTPGSGKKVWWLCEEGHEWQAVIYSRSRGSGCPHCHKSTAVNDDQLTVSESTLVMEWHPTKNGNLSLRHLDSSFGEKVWWICRDGYEWQATVKSRMEGAGCPRCNAVTEQKKSKISNAQIRSGTNGRQNENSSTKNGPTIGPAISDMKTDTDFRKDERFMFQDTVILENRDSGQWSYARSVNISGVGLFFESEIPFNTGARIIVQFNNPPFKSTQKTYPSIVRWCKELAYESIASSYGVGVEFI